MHRPAPSEGVSANDVRHYLDRYLTREPGTKIQYGHPSPRFWTEASLQLPELLAPVNDTHDLSLYLHIPFCPPTTPAACGFCLFAREDMNSYDLVRSYLEALHRELIGYGELLGRRRLRTVYFGGGTPNILKVQEIRDIFARINEYFEVTPTTEITYEGTPSLFTQNRLETLAEVGATRISIGAQMLKPHLVKYSGRKQRPEHIEKAARFCADHGIRCSVDLITGWFEQTPQDLVDDIDCLTDWGVTGIVNHPLTVQGDSEFARRKNELPPVETTCRSFLTAREHMLKRGYRADSYTDYCRSDLPVVQYLEIYRDLLKNDRVGVGYGANTMLTGSLDDPGHTYKNVIGVPAYRMRLEEQGNGMDAVFKFNREDLQLLYVMKGLEGYPYLDQTAYTETFGSCLIADYRPWWTELERRNWLEWDEGNPRLINEGVFYMSTIQRSISERRNAELRGEMSVRGAA